jgi:uncharacterized protein (TIGR02301 family)
LLLPHFWQTRASKLKGAPTVAMVMREPHETSSSYLAKRHRGITPPHGVSSAVLVAVMLLAATLPAPNSAWSQATKPYDPQLLRLSEILGAVHYLRELCGAGDGQLWREQMRTLITAEGSTALRRARLTRSFNAGYRSYSRTYKVCTASAKIAIERFLTEGTEIAEKLVKSNP